jgi:carbon-monoxide dehydrogenase medium subunit
VITAQFDYHSPTSIGDALKLLKTLGDDAKLLAGGHSLLPMMKLRFAEPSHLIDLGKIGELKGIREESGKVIIGAMTTEHEIVNSKVLMEKVPLLVEGARQIADPQVRYKGTIGGDISHGDPGNDHPALMLALDATFILSGPNGEREVAANGYFLGLYSTLLEPGELLKEIRIPIPPAGTGSAYKKLKRKTGDWATAASAVVLQRSGDKIASIRIALTNAAATALRAEAAEACLTGRVPDAQALNEAAEAAMAICEPMPDLRGDEHYKRAMSGEMTRRAIEAAYSVAGR